MKSELTNFNYDGFKEIELFPKADDHSGCVYVLVFSKDRFEIPFYVGQTTRFLGRMDDYFWADFQATTDFRVGQAIKYLCSLEGGKVLARYQACADPRAEENAILNKLREGKAILLNGTGYDYKRDDKDAIADSVQEKCKAIIAAGGGAPQSSLGVSDTD